MKKLLFVFWILIPFVGFAALQTDSVFKINKLPKGGVILKDGWRFTSGDDPAFARPDYNDSLWQQIDPSLLRPQLPKAAQQGIGWLRIKLAIAPSLRRNAAIIIIQSTALEVYMDGKLIGSRGSFNNRLKTGRGYFNGHQPIELPVTNDSEQVLAIRFAHQPSLRYFNGYSLLPFARIYFVNTPQLINNHDLINNIEFALLVGFGILLFLGVFHSILYRYRAQNRGNLYFACYAICFAFYLFEAFINFLLPLYVDVGSYLSLLAIIIYVVGILFGIRALYILFKFPVGWAYKLLVIISLLGILGWVFLETFEAYTFWAVIVLGNGAQLWLTLKAARYKKRGAFVVAAGFLISVIGVVSYMYTSFNELLPNVISICMIALGPPLGISFFLAKEFALDGQLLQVKLHQVEELSLQNLAQEMEKQQILARQNETLELQVDERTAALNQSIKDLKQTQTQLIQSEKMASLGELTAGIAHEIQNPLNFINNFSEVNTELISEMREEIDKSNFAEVKAIAEDIKENQQKINQHGKRADFIVKGMLQHSRTSTGERQPININTLVDEYLKLSYSGLRAKDKSLSIDLITHFEPDLPKVTVIQQDIGRVMLNLFNNAFYAVSKKQKTEGPEYKPEVLVTTLTENKHVIIKVRDNGNGIPENIQDKIMQPFFTTKPTGEGTGLGLSLSYDMVVKGHSGQLNVNTKEGEFTEFSVVLPIN